ncbi:MAG: hypothetical protein ACRC0A_06620 [Chitinophagaceae bacterium]
MKNYFVKNTFFYVYFVVVLSLRFLLFFTQQNNYLLGLYYIVFSIGFFIVFRYNINRLNVPINQFAEYIIYAFRIVAWICIFIIVEDIILQKIMIQNPQLPLPSILLTAILPQVILAFGIAIISFFIRTTKK